MKFTNDSLKNTFIDIKKMFTSRRLTLLKCSSKLLTSYSYINTESDSMEKLLIDLKKALDDNSYCISICDELIEKLDKDESESVFLEKIDMLIKNIGEIDNFIDNFIENFVVQNNCPLNTNSYNKEMSMKEEVNDNTIKDKELSDNTTKIEDNNILLVSEKQGKVFLPYKVSDLENELKNNASYSSLQEIIDDKYILPFSTFSNPVISRFKLVYNLSREKSSNGMISSLELAFELAFQYNLNPAVVAACKNLDELDIYLDCLEENELDKFDIFEIKYEINPR